MSNVIIIELAWTVIALLGTVFTSLALLNVIQDLRAIRAKQIPASDASAILARSHFRSEAIRLAIQLIFLAIGCIALLAPLGRIDGGSVIMVVRIVIPLGLTAGALLLVIKTLLDWIDRKRAVAAELARIEAAEREQEQRETEQHRHEPE